MGSPARDRDMSITSIIGSAVPAAAPVEDVRIVHAPRLLQRRYEARLSDGSALLLCLPPPPMVKLLRSERACVSAEAAVLAWLGDLLCYASTSEPPPQPPHPPQLSHPPPPLSSSARRTVAPAGGGGGRVTDGHSHRHHQDTPAPPGLDIYVPALLAHSPRFTLADPEFNIVKPTLGTPIAGLTPPLTPAERYAVDFQHGCLLRRLSAMRSPSGRFGPALGVLGGVQAAASSSSSSSPSSSSARKDRGGTTRTSPCSETTRGSSTWTTAFAALLEGILRDGEDMHVTLPYAAIRHHFGRLAHLLDAVVTSRLVVVDAGEDHNMLVLRGAPASPVPKWAAASPAAADGSPGGSSRKGRKTQTPTDRPPRSRLTKNTDFDPEPDSIPTASITVTGLRDWSNCVFGDPLFSMAFCQRPSDDLWRGFNHPPLHGEGPAGAGAGYYYLESPVEDEENAATRMLLYEGYHTITQLVREFYRPSRDNSRRELAARKALNGVLARLKSVPDADGIRRPRPGVEVSPAKRYKADEDRSEGGDDDDSDSEG